MKNLKLDENFFTSEKENCIFTLHTRGFCPLIRRSSSTKEKTGRTNQHKRYTNDCYRFWGNRTISNFPFYTRSRTLRVGRGSTTNEINVYLNVYFFVFVPYVSHTLMNRENELPKFKLNMIRSYCQVTSNIL